MDPIAPLREEIRRSVHGEAWHGPALLEALGEVSAAEAAAHPIEGAHSIWEIALHCTGWMREVVERLSGAAPGPPAGGDWPPPSGRDDIGWRAARAGLESAVSELDSALSAFPAERLSATVGGEARDSPLGTGVSYDLTLHGVAQHNAYHAGQVMLLRRALRAAHPAGTPDDGAG